MSFWETAIRIEPTINEIHIQYTSVWKHLYAIFSYKNGLNPKRIHVNLAMPLGVFERTYYK